MRLVHGPDGPRDVDLGPGQLLDLYPWPVDRRWVRAMMVTTLDGAAAGSDGLSGSISSGSDRAVFESVRRLADAVLVGAATLRAERYGPMREVEDAHAAALRRERGKAPAPVLALVSGNLDLPWSDPVFAESAVRPIVLTGTAADAEARVIARAHCDLVELETDRVGAADALDALDARGLPHVVCEGGPTLLESMVAGGLLDEADITLSPRFAGTAQTPRTPGLEEVATFELAHLLVADDGFLMGRYLREGRGPA